MPYDRMWSMPSPGCVVFVVDQSAEMLETFGSSDGAGQRTCDLIATTVNSALAELIDQNTLPPDNIRPRVEVAVIGYGGNGVASMLPPPLDPQPVVGLRELDANPLRVEARRTRMIDPGGNLYDAMVAVPIWVEARAGGGAPMCAALRRAREITMAWATMHQGSFPPTVVLIAGSGAPQDGDPTVEADLLTQVSTRDGNLLLCIVQVTNEPTLAVELPSCAAQLPPNVHARRLFEMASVIPGQPWGCFGDDGLEIAPGARAYTLNSGFLFFGLGMFPRRYSAIPMAAPDPSR